MPICFGTGPDGHFYECEDPKPCDYPAQGKWLKRWRKAQGWSLRQLSVHLDVSIVRASELERGLAALTEEEARACGYQTDL
jgi:hypothetical protein